MEFLIFVIFLSSEDLIKLAKHTPKHKTIAKPATMDEKITENATAKIIMKNIITEQTVHSVALIPLSSSKLTAFSNKCLINVNDSKIHELGFNKNGIPFRINHVKRVSFD